MSDRLQARTRSGGVVGLAGSDWEADLSEHGPHGGYTIQLRRSGNPPAHTVRTDNAAGWRAARAQARQLLQHLAAIDTLAAAASPIVAPARDGRTPSAYYVYAVELADQAAGARGRAHPDLPCVYIGQSYKSPEVRRDEHRRGYRAAAVVRTHGKDLLPHLYQHYNPLASRAQSLQMEAALYALLQSLGYTVFGGH